MWVKYSLLCPLFGGLEMAGDSFGTFTLPDEEKWIGGYIAGIPDCPCLTVCRFSKEPELPNYPSCLLIAHKNQNSITQKAYMAIA